ncbi:MAG: hypothetical protein LBR25_02750 [Erysipelotrichaceae bacterium]|jgi:hypothetical protein|nr:hypothetical protein [Erysipelotrichaceae bacterium]
MSDFNGSLRKRKNLKPNIILLSVLFFIFLAFPFGFLFYVIFQGRSDVWYSPNLIFIIGLFILVLIFKEVIRVGIWTALDREVDFVDFRVSLRQTVTFVYNTKVTRMSAYRLGILLPGLILGVALILYSFLSANLYMLAAGIFALSTSLKDAVIFISLLREKPDSLIEDPVNEPYCYILEEEISA